MLDLHPRGDIASINAVVTGHLLRERHDRRVFLVEVHAPARPVLVSEVWIPRSQVVRSVEFVWRNRTPRRDCCFHVRRACTPPAGHIGHNDLWSPLAWPG